MSVSGFLSGGTLVTPAITYPTSPKANRVSDELDFGGGRNTGYDGSYEVHRGFQQPRLAKVLTYDDISEAGADTLRDFYKNSARGPEITFRLLDPVDGVTVIGNFRFREDALVRGLFDHDAENVEIPMTQVFEYTTPWSTFADHGALSTSLVFPSAVVPQFELEDEVFYRTLIPEADVGGVESRLRSPGWPAAGKRRFSLKWAWLDETDVDVLWDFYRNDAQAWLVPFTLHDPRDGTTDLGKFRFDHPIARREQFVSVLFSIGLVVVED